MAAAALLRSMARKLARSPPHPRPLLAAGRGLQVGARSPCPGGSLPPPTATSKHGGRSVVGTAAASGLRSGAVVFPSLAHAPPQPHHPRLLLRRGLHSRAVATTAPPPSTSGGDKDAIIKELRRRLWHARAFANIGCFMFAAIAIYVEFWLMPATKEARAMVRAFNMLGHEDVPASVRLALLTEIAAAQHGKQQQQPDGEGTRSADIEQEEFLKLYKMLDEAAAMVEEEFGADLKELRAVIARIIRLLESDDSKDNKGSDR